MEIKGEKIYYLFNLCVHDKTENPKKTICTLFAQSVKVCYSENPACYSTIPRHYRPSSKSDFYSTNPELIRCILN